MMRTGVANLPLHPGKAPPWLFRRMVSLSGAISEAVVEEHGQKELLARLSDPCWFQAFGCALGFDWHSSGLTTTVCGALKESLNNPSASSELGIFVAGGKGKTSRKAPSEIESAGESFSLSNKTIGRLLYASRMSAKVDNSCVQDGYQLYHHSFFFTEKGSWAVVQQGMNQGNRYARRYHWISDRILENAGSFVFEPHAGICAGRKESNVLDLTARESEEVRKASVDIVRDGQEHVVKYFSPRGQKTLLEFGKARGRVELLPMPRHHPVSFFDMSARSLESLRRAYEVQPKDYEELVSLKGIGPQKLRALALISELVYGAKASWKDPAKYSFAHGGKDGHPYPVDRKAYDHSIRVLRDALDRARIGDSERKNAVKRLSGLL